MKPCCLLAAVLVLAGAGRRGDFLPPLEKDNPELVLRVLRTWLRAVE